MAGDELKIRVVLDVEGAKRALGDIDKKGQDTADGVGESLRSRMRSGLGLVGLGGVVDDAKGALRGPTAGGVSDVIGEALGPIGTQLSQFFLGSLGEEARASRSAREDTIAAFGTVAGQQNGIPSGARSYFNNLRSIYQTQEHGRTLFEASTDFSGPGFDKIVEKIMEGIGKLLTEAVDHLAEKLFSFGKG